MGLIVDTTLFVRAERSFGSLGGFSENKLAATEEDEFAVSAVTLMEFAFGQSQATSTRSVNMRRRFIAELQTSFVTIPINDAIAMRAGLLRGTLSKMGFTIGLADMIIAATALELGFGVFTHKVKHFEYVPDLRVVNAADE